MKKNMGGADRIIRGLIGIALIAWGYSTGTWWGAIGIIPLFTAFVSWCPAYLPFKINTGKKA